MAVIEQTMIDVVEPGWYPDPANEHHMRYFDGGTWTDHVTHNGPTPCTGCSYGDSASRNS